MNSHPFRMLWAMRNNTYIENISQLAHSIQCANLALENDHRKNIVLACLFHDIGHYDIDKEKVVPMIGKDDRYLGVKNHEYVGYKLLKRHGFSDETCHFVKNHVVAKRYLCTVDKDYYNKLSDQSKATFNIQGGVLTDKQLLCFERSKYFSGSIFVRSYDDLAKKPNNMSDEKLFSELCKFEKMV